MSESVQSVDDIETTLDKDLNSGCTDEAIGTSDENFGSFLDNRHDLEG